MDIKKSLVNIKKLTGATDDDIDIINKKIFKNVDKIEINEEFINSVFALKVETEKKFLFFFYLISKKSMNKEEYKILRNKLCDSNTWGKAKLDYFELKMLIAIYKVLNKHDRSILYECDEIGIKYIDKIETFLIEYGELSNHELRELDFDCFKEDVYSSNICKYFNELLELDETQIKDKIIDTFGDKVSRGFVNKNLGLSGASFLLFCQEIEDDEKSLNYSKIFLELGVNPNYLATKYMPNGWHRYYSAINIAILNKRDINYIYNLLNEYIKYNFDVTQCYRFIFSDMIDNNISTSDILKIYKLLLNTNINNSRFFEQYIFDGLDKDKAIEVRGTIYFTNILHLLKKQLELNEYDMELDYNDFIFENSHNLYILYENIACLMDAEEEEFIELICNTIIENRNKCINVIDKKISVSEILECFKTIKDNEIAKLNSKYNGISEKVLTYQDKKIN